VVLSCLFVETRWLPACFVIAAICPIVLVLSAFAWVGFSALVVFVPVPFLGFSRPAGGSSSRLVPLVPFLFLFLFLLPSVWVLVVAVFLLWFSNFYFGGSALWWWRVVVVWCCVFFLFPFSFLRVEGGGGWVAILLSNPKVSSGKLHLRFEGQEDKPFPFGSGV
jgi:hypothetical protein